MVTEDEAALLDTLERFRLGWERLDPDTVLSTFARRGDIVVYGTDAGEQWIGYEALVEPFRAQAKAFANPTYAWAQGDPHLWVSGDAAWACGQIMVSLEVAGNPIELTMRSTFVLTRGQECWRIVHAHFSVGLETPAAPYT